MAGTFFVDVFTPDTVAGFVLAVAVALALFISIAAIGILLARSLVRERQYALILQRETSTVRLFRIDRHQRQVSYFNLSDLRNVKTVPPDDFYSSFPASERERLETWVDDLLDGKPSPDYLELDVYIGKKRSKQRVPSFLKMTDVDVPKGVLHLESYLLSGMAPSEGQSFRLSTEDDFSSALKSNGSSVGFTFCFSFFPVRRGNKPANARPKLTREQVSRFRSLVAPYVKGSQRLIQCSESELLLANFDMAEKSEAIDFALRSGKGIDGLLIATRKKREPLFVCRLGIVANRDLPGDADAIIAEARNAASLARENGVGFEFYSRSREAIAPSEEAGIFKNEVDRIIDEKKIDFSYRPVYSVNRRFVYAYLALARPINTSFASIDELKNYARRAQDDKNLFAHLAKSIVSRFVSERELKSQRLVYPVRYDELPLIQSFFPRYRTAKDANLVFLFREEDVVQNVPPGRIDDFLLALQSLRDKGFQVSFSLSGNSLVLDHRILALSDAFYVDFSYSGGTHMDSRLRSQLHALVEKLLRYKRPIVAMGLLNWTALELVVGSGIDYISADCFAPYDQNLLPVNPKNINRIQNLRERK